MSAKDILEKIRQAIKATGMFADTPAVNAPDAAPAPTSDPVPVLFSYPVDGGQPVFVNCADDGVADVDVNDPVYTDAAMSAPYPDGTYKVTGTDFGFTVAGGIVSAVVDADGTGPGDPIPDGSSAAPAPVTTELETDANKTMEDRIAAINSRVASLESSLGKFSSQDELLVLKLKSENQGKIIKQIFEMLEMMVKEPTAPPKTLTERQKLKASIVESKDDQFRGILDGLKKATK